MKIFNLTFLFKYYYICSIIYDVLIYTRARKNVSINMTESFYNHYYSLIYGLNRFENSTYLFAYKFVD